jgi:hypothetical protein
LTANWYYLPYPCHSERSEESLFIITEILRSAQNDSAFSEYYEKLSAPQLYIGNKRLNFLSPAKHAENAKEKTFL